MSAVVDTLLQTVMEGVSPYFWKARSVIPGKSSETITVNGISAEFHTKTRMEFRMFATEGFDERPVIEDLLAELNDGEVFYDVGANLGLYSCLAGRKGARVIAFEPTSVVADRLEANILRNGVDVTVSRYGLADEEYTATLELNMNWSDELKEIQMVRGDDHVRAQNFPVPNVLKIDVEGGELAVIRGLSETLSNPECRAVYCEVHPEKLKARGLSPDDVSEELQALGFSLSRIQDRGYQYHLRAIKAPSDQG